MRTAGRLAVLGSINGQITILLVAALLTVNALLIGLVLFGAPLAAPTFATDSAVGSIASVVRAFDSDPDGQERALAWADKAVPGMTLLPAAPDAIGSTEPPLTVLKAKLGAVLGDRDRVVLWRPSAADEAIAVAVRLKSGTWAGFPVAGGVRYPSLTMFLGLAASIAATSIALSVWAARQLTAPLTRFADAAEQFGATLAGEPLAENGPTEIRRATSAFNRMRDSIRRLVEERTFMLAAISHDLRTPLTRLHLRVETMTEPETRRQALGDIRSIETLLNSALAYLRGEGGRRRREMVSLPSLLQTVCNEFADMGMDVTYEGPQRAAAECDGTLIARAVTNLVDNAMQHGTRTTVRLTSLWPGKAAIEVTDDGGGLSDDEKVRMLEPFHRGDQARGVRDKSGFGLGLTIAKSIVEDHGGTITLADAAPTGLTVRIVLPAAHA